ncbi:MAG: hypothetical protein ACXQTW_04750 [Candidatus Methanospirareceae archaeon]
MKEVLYHEKCLNCDHITCANLSLKRDELDGGEIYLLDESILALTAHYRTAIFFKI